MDMISGQLSSGSSYRAAEMTIQLRNPEVSVDMQPVWDSMDLKNSMVAVREQLGKSEQQIQTAIEQQAREGNRMRDSLVTKEKNPFGNMALEKLQRLKQPQLQYMLVPSRGPEITVQVYKPDIHIEPNFINLRV